VRYVTVHKIFTGHKSTKSVFCDAQPDKSGHIQLGFEDIKAEQGNCGRICGVAQPRPAAEALSA